MNSADTARVLDPDGYVVSILSWGDAVSGRIYRPAVLLGERVKARVVRVIDGDTVDIILTDVDQLTRIPSSIKHRWLWESEKKDGALRVRFIGIDTPETVHPRKPVEWMGKEASAANRLLVEGRKVQLEYDAQRTDKYGRTVPVASAALRSVSGVGSAASTSDRLTAAGSTWR